MASFPFELVSPERLLFSGEVEQVVVPGSEGEFTVLKDHAPVMTTLRPGFVYINATSGEQILYVRGGFADVAPTGLTILAEIAVPVSDFDAARLAREIELAKEEAGTASTEETKRRADEKVGQLEQLRVVSGAH
jgi:F-type H+-transporting ATPase subunit epsilon